MLVNYDTICICQEVSSGIVYVHLCKEQFVQNSKLDSTCIGIEKLIDPLFVMAYVQLLSCVSVNCPRFVIGLCL